MSKEETGKMVNLNLEDRMLTARDNRRPGDFETLARASWDPEGEFEQALTKVIEKEEENK